MRCALVTGVQTCALPISMLEPLFDDSPPSSSARAERYCRGAVNLPERKWNRLALGGQTLLALTRGRKRYLRALRALLAVSGIYAHWRATGSSADLHAAHHRAGLRLADRKSTRLNSSH